MNILESGWQKTKQPTAKPGRLGQKNRIKEGVCRLNRGGEGSGTAAAHSAARLRRAWVFSSNRPRQVPKIIGKKIVYVRPFLEYARQIVHTRSGYAYRNNVSIVPGQTCGPRGIAIGPTLLPALQHGLRLRPARGRGYTDGGGCPGACRFPQLDRRAFAANLPGHPWSEKEASPGLATGPDSYPCGQRGDCPGGVAVPDDPGLGRDSSERATIAGDPGTGTPKLGDPARPLSHCRSQFTAAQGPHCRPLQSQHAAAVTRGSRTAWWSAAMTGRAILQKSREPCSRDTSPCKCAGERKRPRLAKSSPHQHRTT